MEKKPRVKNTEMFIDRAKEMHGDLYSYDKSIYVRSTEKVIITCSPHGDFAQVPVDHIRGAGCPQCAGNVKSSSGDFVTRAAQVHNGKFSYAKVEYVNSKTGVTITCPVHGDFQQAPYEHLSGKGCYACSGRMKKTTEQFIAEAMVVHNGKYGYERAIYDSATTKVIITCPSHGDFTQTPNNHLSGYGCAECAGCAPKSNSIFLEQAEQNKYVYELDLREFLTENGIDFVANSRRIIDPLELDIYIPSHNLAIEINGLRFHSDRLRAKRYHYEKWKACDDIGVKLLHVNEDEWVERSDCVKRKILNLCGLSVRGPGARKLEVKEIPISDAKNFTEKNHIQGRVNGIIVAFGAFDAGDLIGVMTFSYLRASKDIVLSRFCTDGKVYAGLFSKMFKFAVREKGYSHVITFADRRYSDGHLYQATGFEHTSDTPITYRYVRGKRTFDKQEFTKEKIKKRFGIDWGTEREMMEHLGYERIYDCGKMRFEWASG